MAWLVRWHLADEQHRLQARHRGTRRPSRLSSSACSRPSGCKLLLVLTVADIRAVGPKVWNGWKAALLRELYHSRRAT